MNCETCRFWENPLCRRRCPQVDSALWPASDAEPDKGIWPMTDKSDWCGEYQERDEG